jgi:hypothetical protein
MFIKKTVAGVLAGFQRTVDDLRTIASQQTDEAARLNAEARAKLAAAAAADTEASKADDIADRIEKLIS